MEGWGDGGMGRWGDGGMGRWGDGGKLTVNCQLSTVNSHISNPMTVNWGGYSTVN